MRCSVLRYRDPVNLALSTSARDVVLATWEQYHGSSRSNMACHQRIRRRKWRLHRDHWRWYAPSPPRAADSWLGGIR